MKTEQLEKFPLTSAVVSALHYLEQTESTNSVMATQDSWSPFSLVLAGHQTAGRGRLGRVWVSRPGESVAFSVMVPGPGSGTGPGLTWIPLVAGACLVEALRSVGLSEAGLKWPNDVLVGGKKISGVLCEVHRGGGVIVGVGLNRSFVAQPPTENAVALADFIDVGDGLVDAVLAQFVVLLRSFHTAGHVDAHDFVTERLLTVGHSVEVVPVLGKSFRGIAQGVDDEGRLVVRNAAGEDVGVVAADVHHLYQ
jgi:BirA family biotin operon repressor/biotin-[acetyl-CoA-carboxylase] ligase